MDDPFNITRQIGIDMGHRVPDHGSKCKNLHGHRYTIYATCTGDLTEEGEQTGMVLDFGFLKEEMMNMIDHYCDHGCVLRQDDELVKLIYPETHAYGFTNPCETLKGDALFFAEGKCKAGKVVLVPFTPTAENLAKWWYTLLQERVEIRSNHKAKLTQLTVWETPNCSASYPSK